MKTEERIKEEERIRNKEVERKKRRLKNNNRQGVKLKKQKN